jgi:hypothetical protein
MIFVMEDQKYISVGSTEFLYNIQMNFILERLKINGTAVMSMYLTGVPT